MITKLSDPSILGTIVSCPYCGHEQYHDTERSVGQELVYCDPEAGGCDQYYALFWSTKIEWKTHKLDLVNPPPDILK